MTFESNEMPDGANFLKVRDDMIVTWYSNEMLILIIMDPEVLFTLYQLQYHLIWYFPQNFYSVLLPTSVMHPLFITLGTNTEFRRLKKKQFLQNVIYTIHKITTLVIIYWLFMVILYRFESNQEKQNEISVTSHHGLPNELRSAILLNHKK